MSLFFGAKQKLYFLFLLCLFFNSQICAQNSVAQNSLDQAQIVLDNGNYLEAIEKVEASINKLQNSTSVKSIVRGFHIIASSQINLEKYSEAESTLNRALSILPTDGENSLEKANIFLDLAWLWRSQRDTQKALDYGSEALAAAPNSREVRGKYYLNIGRVLFSSGYDLAAIIWLEKAEEIFESEKYSEEKLDTYRFLSLAWSSKFNRKKALEYAEKRVSLAENSRFLYKYRQSLYEWGNLLSATGQKHKAFNSYEKGLKLALQEKNNFQARNFLSILLFNSLYEMETVKAKIYLEKFEKIDSDKEFSFDILLGKAVVAAFEGKKKISDQLFTELDKMESDSEFMLPLWKITVAEKNKDWERLIEINREVFELTLKNNFRDDLPNLYLNFAKAFYHLGQNQKALENLEKSLSLIEEIRQTENTNLSLGLLETYHNAYRLLAQIKSGIPQESFELADFLKARVLKDKTDNSALKAETNLSPAIRQKLEELSSRFIADQSIASEIEKTEKSVTSQIPDLNLTRPDLTELNNIPELNNTAIISYFFTLDRKLQAFVWEKNKPLKTINIPTSEDEVENYAKTTHRKIKDFIFFKKDGKEIHDKLLKPLNLSAKHLIIIPDKSLWKIPFQALSPDGEKYLIEENLISYAPSVSILLQQLKNPKPNRFTLQAFANSSFDNRILQYVNAEAASVSDIYNSKPLINANIADFERFSDKADILHFSMHAQVDNEQPLESFLGFRNNGKEDGRLTVGEILDINLKKESLVFLASCDTNNVSNSEGLVSLAWAMLGSGATTVISAQWEASDKSTEIFTKTFYNHYKQGNTSAAALQRASLELIKNKSNNMHEPYYWAVFTVNSDFR